MWQNIDEDDLRENTIPDQSHEEVEYKDKDNKRGSVFKKLFKRKKKITRD